MTDISNIAIKRRTIPEKEGGLTRRHRRIVILVGPGNNIGVREERGRETYYISARELFDHLEYRTAQVAGLVPAPRKRGPA